MKYYFIAGEASGDLHASNLIREIKKLDSKADIRAWGGDLMKNQGVKIVKHYRDLAFMGFAEVIMNLRTILRNFDECKKDILAFRPDVLILIDYPGFNLRIAKFAHQNGMLVHYYISPQIWAWKRSRVHTIRRVVDKMMVILPFEKDFYQQYGMDVDFVGHPLLDAIESSTPDDNFIKQNQLKEKPIIALLPGSRKQEISQMLHTMLEMVSLFPEHQFVISGAPSIESVFYNKLIANKEVKIIYGKTYDLLRHSIAAIVTSGTATLETALFGVPEVVCYKGNFVSYEIAKRIIHIKYISLVNLIMDQKVVTELIQNKFNKNNLKAELHALIFNEEKQEKLARDYAELKERLGGKGASAKAAALIVAETLKKVNQN
ncbi:MAG: lipid-A-disaccharide synthase [Bacteroidetes bacterium HGW-Bacteroidetes-1]|jgi:lipid-A-disaccharide synthase|nr:MAG: lipid-A-disaccharide synthase [Bacteroidetes bacterium HGW-Bacteroidetes-1]